MAGAGHMDHNRSMEIERGTIGKLPYAAIGRGDPLLVIAGLMPYTGPGPDRMARAAIGWITEVADRRRFVLVNRRTGLPRGTTMAELAGEHADAIRDGLGGKVDVMGTSTGGSIAQQLAADHPDVVGRLFLLSTACRLGPQGKVLQRRVAARIRAGARRQATAVMVAEFAPTAVAVAASLIGPLVLRGDQAWDDLAATIEAEDEFDLARLGPIRAPTLIVCGRDDIFYPPELFEETARLIPGSELVMLEDRGHIDALSDPRARDAIRALL
jgi:pimeloyl-ACP methyl ester carboxylesterase